VATRVVSADPETAWSLLSSAQVWSLRPGYFAFDAVVPDSPPVRCLLHATTSVVRQGVLTLRSEQPGVAASWGFPRGGTVTFSVRPRRGGAVVAISLRLPGDSAIARRLFERKRTDQVMDAWLARAWLVLEGREPWPAGMPADVAQACGARPPWKATDSVSASVLIAAPLDVVWEAIWSPTQPGDGTLASGQVPGTPVREPGEMQYVIRRNADGQLAMTTVIVREMAYQHSALTDGLGLTHPEMSYLLTEEKDGVRLEMTSSWHQPAMVGEPQAVRNQNAQFVRSVTAEYKAAIEKAG
jgi:hypothetical protein